MPAATARRAADTYSCVTPASSSVSKARGVTAFFGPSSVMTSMSGRTALGATGARPSGCSSGWPIRPPCISWITMRPPAACTASATRAHPACCASFAMPGTWA